MSSKRSLVYIMSPSYSGSTLLTRILAQYKQISTIGELKATGIDDIHQYYCSCGSKFLECEFWVDIAARVAKKDIVLDLEDLRTRITSESSLVNAFLMPNLRGPLLEGLRRLAFSVHPNAKAILDDQLRRNAEIIEAVCDSQGGDVFVDESKDPLRALYFAQSGIWNFKVVQLVRDGRGTVNSDITHNGRSVKEACTEWNLKIDEMNRFRAMVDCDLMQVTYESLCLEPEQTIGQILQFAGIADTRVVQETAGTQQHIIGNDMRLKPMRQIKLDEKWRTGMTPEQLEEFYRCSEQRNKLLGYKT